MKSRTDSLQIATVIVLVVIVYLLLQISSRQKTMQEQPEGTGQIVGKKLPSGGTAQVERLDGESLEDFTARFKEAIEIAEAEE